MKANSILMLENDSDDRQLTQEIIHQTGIGVHLHFLKNKDQLFAYLKDHVHPAIILIDYNLEPENGLQILKALKEDQNLVKIPVIILSDTTEPAYIEQCYRAGASTFIKKPETFAETSEKIKAFIQYWIQVAEV